MYLDSFGLKKKPFSLTSDPSTLYLTDYRREALAALCYGVLERKGLLLLLLVAVRPHPPVTDIRPHFRQRQRP